MKWKWVAYRHKRWRHHRRQCERLTVTNELDKHFIVFVSSTFCANRGGIHDSKQFIELNLIRTAKINVNISSNDIGVQFTAPQLAICSGRKSKEATPKTWPLPNLAVGTVTKVRIVIIFRFRVSLRLIQATIYFWFANNKNTELHSDYDRSQIFGLCRHFGPSNEHVIGANIDWRHAKYTLILLIRLAQCDMYIMNSRYFIDSTGLTLWQQKKYQNFLYSVLRC